MPIGELLGGLGGAIGNLAIMGGAAGRDGQEERRRILELFQSLDLPQFDTSRLSDPILREVAAREAISYDPSLPPDPRLVGEDPAVRQAQSANLAYLSDLRDRGMSENERLAAQDISRDLSRAHQRNIQAGTSELQRRGRYGGGEEAIMRAAAGQQSAELARGQGTDLQRQMLDRRLQGALGAGGQAQTMRLQDLQAETSRADTMNNYNALISQLLTNAAQNNALAGERAQSANVEARQGRADTNVLNQYQNRAANQGLRNTTAQQQFGNRLSRAQGSAGALSGIAQGQDARQAANAATIRSLGTGLGSAVGGGVDLAMGTPASSGDPFEMFLRRR